MAEELNQPNACRPIENAKIHEKPKNESKYPFGSPVKVSPFIKLGRYTFLVLGIFYGAYHQRRFVRKEAELRERNAKIEAERAARLAEIKKKLDEEINNAIEKVGAVLSYTPEKQLEEMNKNLHVQVEDIDDDDEEEDEDEDDSKDD